MKARVTRRAKRGSLASRWLAVLPAVTLAIAAAILEAWQQPPAWLLSERRTDIQALHWLRIHLLNTAGITALATVATAVIPLFIWLRDRRPPEKALRKARADAKQRREHRALLRLLHDKWIADVLGPSLPDTGLIKLHLTRPEEFKQPGIRAARNPGHTVTAAMHRMSCVDLSDYASAIPRETSLLDLFEDAGRALLLLGPPGAGKTTMMLQLAKDLLQRAQLVPGQPVPVILSLESWAAERLSMATWLEQELVSRYRMAPRTASAWVSQNSLVLLLDSLDEVPEPHRQECVRAINSYRAARTPPRPWRCAPAPKT